MSDTPPVFRRERLFARDVRADEAHRDGADGRPDREREERKLERVA